MLLCNNQVPLLHFRSGRSRTGHPMTCAFSSPTTALAARVASESGGPLDACVGNADGSVLMLRHTFAAAQGAMGEGSALRIGLLTAGGGALYQRTALGRIAQPWRAGAFTVVLPDCPGEFRSPALALLGLAIDARHLQGRGVRVEQLHWAASALQEDPVIASVMGALWHCAEAHAGSAAFFEHGVDLVLKRLAGLPVAAPATRRALSPTHLKRVQELIDAHLGDDLGVARMAQEVGQEASGFSRGFRIATGMTPYAYLTWRRMEAAKPMLLAGRSVTEVALAMGYANPGKFAAAFRRVTGQAPSRWAGNARGELAARV
ncbi:AraC family transcriptional regulator [Stenotrophomonas rhizophila]|uniref:AraC family transcriptional regulator n=1 Tax=Stenotrophomonas rhizophila TaxID=216778 RepID=A0A498CV26_9GAMM|nr:AraC family transcriptional regulator [Stenotrophomonas rhizophila]